jgi:hypothetical protein
MCWLVLIDCISMAVSGDGLHVAVSIGTRLQQPKTHGVDMVLRTCGILKRDLGTATYVSKLYYILWALQDPACGSQHLSPPCVALVRMAPFGSVSTSSTNYRSYVIALLGEGQHLLQHAPWQWAESAAALVLDIMHGPARRVGTLVKSTAAEAAAHAPDSHSSSKQQPPCQPSNAQLLTGSSENHPATFNQPTYPTYTLQTTAGFMSGLLVGHLLQGPLSHQPPTATQLQLLGPDGSRQ